MRRRRTTYRSATGTESSARVLQAPLQNELPGAIGVVAGKQPTCHLVETAILVEGQAAVVVRKDGHLLAPGAQGPLLLGYVIEQPRANAFEREFRVENAWLADRSETWGTWDGTRAQPSECWLVVPVRSS